MCIKGDLYIDVLAFLCKCAMLVCVDFGVVRAIVVMDCASIPVCGELAMIVSMAYGGGPK